jgi:A/G-specific adenine glycosylase
VQRGREPPVLKPDDFRKRLERWWRSNGRSFPWRETRDAYRILISEVLLHRTRAEQVRPIFEQFVQEYPTPSAIVQGGHRVRALMDKLGLHWRTERLLEMAGEIDRRFGGTVPSDQESLRSLPGVSDYISAAVCCFAFDLPAVLLDTNITRIVSRIEGLPLSDSSRRSVGYRNELSRLLPSGGSRIYYYALIDLGAAVCRSRSPRCSECPFSDVCHYALSHQNHLPTRS